MNRPLTVNDVASLLPELEELRPVLDHALARSESDSARAWSGSSTLGAAGDRVFAGDIAQELQAVSIAEQAHLASMYRRVADALERRAEGDLEGCGLALLDAAAAEEDRFRFARAEGFADAAYRALAGAPDSALRGRALRRRARARRAEGRLEAAIADYRRAFELAAASADVQGGAEAAIGAGNCFEDQAMWDDAVGWYRSALKTMDDQEYAGPERWQALLNEHIVLRSRGDLEAARQTLERAEAAAVGFAGADVFIENAWGQWKLAAGDLEGAELRLRSALAARPGGRAQVTVRINLAETLLAAGRTLDAAEETRRAEQEAILGRAPVVLPEVYRLLGRISSARGEGDAFVLFEKALALIDEHGLPAVEKARTAQVYADELAAAGDEERAKELHAEAIRLYGRLGIGERDTWADRHDPVTIQDNERDDS